MTFPFPTGNSHYTETTFGEADETEDFIKENILDL